MRKCKIIIIKMSTGMLHPKLNRATTTQKLFLLYNLGFFFRDNGSVNNLFKYLINNSHFYTLKAQTYLEC